MRTLMVVAALVASVGHASAERLRSPNGEVREVPDASVEYAIKAGWQHIPKVWMRSPNGGAVAMDEDLVSAAERIGAWKMTPEEIKDELERQRLIAEAEEAAAKAEAEARKPGWFEAPPDHGDWRSRAVKWVSDPSEARTLTSLRYVRLTEDEHEALMNERARADEADAEAVRRNRNIWLEKIAGIGAVGLVVALLIRRRLRAK